MTPATLTINPTLPERAPAMQPPAADRRSHHTSRSGPGESFTESLTSAAANASRDADARRSHAGKAADTSATTDSAQRTDRDDRAGDAGGEKVSESSSEPQRDRNTERSRSDDGTSAETARSDAQDAQDDAQQNDDAATDEQPVAGRFIPLYLTAGESVSATTTTGDQAGQPASMRTAPTDAAEVAQQPQAVQPRQHRSNGNTTAQQTGETLRDTLNAGVGRHAPSAPPSPTDTASQPRTQLDQQPTSSQTTLPIDADASASPAERRAMQIEWQLAAQRAGMTSSDASNGSNGRGPATLPLAMMSTAVGAEGSNASTSAAPSANTAMLDDTRMTGQVMRGMTAVMNQRGGSLTMRLDPPELGHLRIQMTIARGSVTAVFHAATDAAREVLERNMTTLRTALERQGLTVERLQVTQPAPSTTQSHTHNTAQNHTQNQSAADQNNTGDRAQHDASDGRSRGFTEHDHDRDQPSHHHDGSDENGERDRHQRRAASTFTNVLNDRASETSQERGGRHDA